MKIIGIDNQEEKIRELNRKKVLITAIISIVLVIFVILFIIYMANKNFRDFIDKYVLMKNAVENSVTSISLDESENYNVFAYDKYICIFKQNMLTAYNSSGKEEYNLKVEISNPMIDTNNRFLLIAEQEKQKIYLISGNNIIWEKELEGNISRVSVNKNGYVSVILTGTTYKSIIQTFDNTGKELFKTYLSTSIAMDSNISHDNKYLSFAEVSTDGTAIQSRIKTISIQKAKETPSEAIISTITSPSDSTVINLKYQDSNRIICMYNDSIHCIQNEKDEELFNLNEEDKKISFEDIKLTNFAYRIVEKSVLLSTDSIVELINTSSKKVNLYTIDSVVKEVYSYDDIVALNLGSEVHFIGTNGWLIKKYISSQEVRKIIMNSNFAAIVYRDKIEIVEL